MHKIIWINLIGILFMTMSFAESKFIDQYDKRLKTVKANEVLDIEAWKWNEDVIDSLMILKQYRSHLGTIAPLPFPPGFMAPIGGIQEGLMYRMLDEAISDKLYTE